MLTLTRLTKGGKKGGNVVAYLQATEYYRDKDDAVQSASSWEGQGAADLGLSGVPTAEQMERLAEGFDPHSSRRKALVPSAGKDTRAIGADATFSAPKSVSLAYAVASPEERDAILGAQRAAVASVLGFIEKEELLRARRGHAGIDSIATQGVVASTHYHFSNRNLEPQLHTHTLLYNVARGEDGQLCCVETNEIFRYQKALGALYRTELARNLEGLGYGIEHTLGFDGLGEADGKDAFEISGISKTLRDHFSTRAKEVEEYQKAHPHARNGALATRKNKDEPTFSELTAEWKKSLGELRAKHPGMVPTTDTLKAHKGISRTTDMADVIDKLHETEAVISRPALLEALAKNSVGKGIDTVLSDEKALAARADIHHIKPERQPGPASQWSSRPTLKHRETRYANSETVAREKGVLTMAAEAAKDTRHSVPMDRVQAGLAAFEARKSEETNSTFRLTPEQRAMVEHTAHATGGIALVVGRAGTGKTTSSEACVEVWKGEGMTVFGAATSWKAAKKLQKESGVEGIALAALAKRIEKKDPDWMPDAKSVLMIDEASLLGTRSFDVVQRAYLKAGGKVILIGDPLQLASVDQGSPFRALIEKHGYAQLEKITRQKTTEGLDLANHFYEGAEQKKGERTASQANTLGKALMKRMDDMGAVHRFDDGKKAVAGLVDAFLSSPEKTSEKLAIAATNADVDEIARGIRQGLKARGELSAVDFHADTITRSGGQQRLALAVGDRIRFKAKVDDRAAKNEDATIQRIRRNATGGLDITVRMDDDATNGKAREFTFDSLQHDQFAYAYAMTAFGAQGQTSHSAFWLGTPTDQHLGLVAATRAKHRLAVFLDKEAEAGFSSSLGRQSHKANALEEGVSQSQRRPFMQGFSAHLDRFKQNAAAISQRFFGEKEQKPKLKNQQRGVTV
ncbi:relaxase domain-containing protein [Bacillus sp. NP157]|nr:relaxase domain-containing protein [Bacillus sp. NP157]